MVVRSIHHASFTVTDLERTVDFYRRVLGMRLLGRKHRKAEDLGDALLGSQAVGADATPGDGAAGHGAGGGRTPRPAEILIADMELDGMQIEFIQYVDPATRPYPGDPSVAGSGHPAFLTEDIEAEVRRLQAAGVSFHTTVRTVRDPGRPLWRWCYFRDPDGIMVELVESAGTAPTQQPPLPLSM